MTQGIPGSASLPVSGPQFPQQSLEGLWPCSCKITLLPASPPLSPGPVRRLYPSGDTQDSRELHWAPKNPGLHRQRPGFTHTSSSRQASSPSQMAEKHPTQVGRTGVRPGDTLSLSMAPAAPASLKGCFLGGGGLGHRRDPGTRAQEGKQTPGWIGRVTGLCPPFSSSGGWGGVGGTILATHGWCILDLSASSLGSTGAQQRGCGTERGQPGGQPGPADGSLSLASAPSGRAGQGSQPHVHKPFPLCP